MELLVVRHGIAVDREEGADEAADAARPLTKRGIRRFRRSVRGLDRLGIIVDHILHSPKRRAVETAQLLAPLLAHDDAFHMTPLLAASPRAELLSQISAFGDARVAVVGHEPYLSGLISL